MPVEVRVRPFMKALNSLLTNPSLVQEMNFSFPDSRNPCSSVKYPNEDDTVISELHHGKWWVESWKQCCEEGSNEILVPIILYMDGIKVDEHGRLNLTPLNMTLGIFNIATRKPF
jgi:hypothetical protein